MPCPALHVRRAYSPQQMMPFRMHAAACVLACAHLLCPSFLWPHRSLDDLGPPSLGLAPCAQRE